MNIELQAQSELNSGHYKEAITLYKKLLQTTENQDWSKQIAYCYLQRADTFAKRGMYKEAMVLWENHQKFTQPPYQSYDQYISWLLQTENQSRIKSCLAELTAKQLDKEYPKLAALLGLLLLTKLPGFLQDLPQDSVFIQHFKLVQLALQAYQDNDQKKVQEALKQLPYRSAFKDFRLLLNAVFAFPDSIELALSQLSKIPSDSPYNQAARLLIACAQDGSALINDMHRLNFSQCRIITEIKGLDKKQLKLIEQVNRQKQPLSDKVKFNLAIQYQSLCKADFSQQFCHALLSSYPAGRRDFNKNFDSINEFEHNRLMALACERKNKGYDAEYYWQQCIRELAQSKTEQNLKIALILRHIASQIEESVEQIHFYIDSLKYDAEDRDSYLKILQYYGQYHDTIKEHKHWLAITLEKFPQDIDVLKYATIKAIGNKTYKKASLHAKKILNVDPLNVFARQALYSNYLAYARLLIQGKKFHLVENEIRQAEALNTNKIDKLQTQLMHGLLCFIAQDKEQGLQLINDSLNKLNSDPVNIQFQGTVEALLTGLPVAPIVKQLPPFKDHLLSTAELNTLVEQIDQFTLAGNDTRLINKALDKIKAVIKKSLLKQDYAENLLLTFCQSLDKIENFELLRHCCKLSLDKWNGPSWIFYHIYSACNGIPERCNFIDTVKLENALDLANQEKDYRAMVLIEAFLDRYYQTNPDHNMGYLKDSLEDDEEYEDPIGALFNHIPDKILNKINKKLQSLTKKTTPEKMAMELIEALGHEGNILSSMMEQPDLFTALMVVKAAQVSGVEINVSYADVLIYFGISVHDNPISH